MISQEHIDRETAREREIPGYSRWSGGIVTGERSECQYCGEDIGAVIDADSGYVDWGSYFSSMGRVGPPFPADFGCSSSPDTNEEGTGSHEPGEGHTPLGFKVLIDSRGYWAEIERQVGIVGQYAYDRGARVPK